jgi:hypothetical protein
MMVNIILSLLLAWGLLGCDAGTELKTVGSINAKKKADLKYQPGTKIIMETKDGQTEPDYPLVLLGPDKVCSDLTFYNQDGDLVQGTRNCDESTPVPVDPNLKAENIKAGVVIGGVEGVAKLSPENCNADGAVNCVAVEDFPAIDKVNKLEANASKIQTGVTLAGIAGSLANCSIDGSIGCVSIAAFPAIDKAHIASSDIRTGISIAGVLGTLSGAPLACSSDGQTNCLAVSNFPAVDKINGLQANANKIRSGLSLAGITGTLSNCSVDGGSGCVAVGPSFAAALTTGASAKILTGQSLAGIAGSASGKPADCTSDGGIGCVTVANFPAVDKLTNLSAAKLAKIHSTVVVGGVTGTLGDCLADGATSCLSNFAFPAANSSGAAAKIITGQTLGGIAGSATPAPADCGTDGATNCVAVALFPAVDKALKLSGANAAKIHSSLSVAGVTGTLVDCAADGATNCLAVSGFPAANGTGASAKILTGQTLAGIAGSGAGRPSDCAADGSINCVAVALYPAVDKATKLSGANASKIHSSLTIAGVVGTMPSCSADGATSCMAVAGYPAANITGAAAKIAAGDTLAGVLGSAGVRPSDCTTDGSTGCVATATYPSANSVGAAAKIAAGDVLAGITGTAGVRPSDCNTDGGTGCVTVANFPAVDKLTKLSVANAAKIRSSLTIAGVVGTLDDCSTDGGIGCVAVGPTYAAAVTTGLAAKVLSGQSVAGVAGSATAAPANCSTDGATGCVAVANFPAVDKLTNLSAANRLKIHSSVTIAALAGTMPSCSADGGTSCMAVSGFPAANTTGAAAKILTGQTLAGVSGSAASAPANCSADGATSCVAVPLFPAVDLASKLIGNSGKIRSSLTIAGVTGTLDDCTSDGGTGCVVVGPTYAAALKTGAAAKILTGQSVAGVGGTALAKPSDCASDGDVNCVATTSFPVVNKTVNLASGNLAKISSSVTVGGVTGTMGDCASDGTINCLAVVGFPAANTTSAAAKIITGQTLAGISGSAMPAPANCATDGGTGCVAVANFPAVDKLTNLVPNLAKIHSSVTVGGSAGTLADCSADGAQGCYTVSAFRAGTYAGAAAKIISGQTLLGVAGSATAAPADCSSDGQTNCVAIATYPALKLSLLTPAVLKNGTVINGVTGAYPSSTYTLPSAGATADLDAATFNAKVKSSTSFECWDSAGTYQIGAGSANITAANIVSGTSIFGTTGTAATPVAPNAWDVRVGTVINGVTGQLKTTCRDRVNSSLRDAGLPYSVTAVSTGADTLTISGHPFTSNMAVRVGALTAPTGITLDTTTYYVIVVDANTIKLSATSGPGSQVDITGAGSTVKVYRWNDGTKDWWDTVEDYNNNGSFPTEVVTAWGSQTDCADDVWTDSTLDGTCNATTDDCIMKDKITNLLWSEMRPATGSAPSTTGETFAEAIQRCAALNFGGYTGWRLPTQKELIEAYTHGLRYVGYNGSGTIRGSGSNNNNDMFLPDVDQYFWSSTILSSDAAKAVVGDFTTGFQYGTPKTDTYPKTACVR